MAEKDKKAVKELKVGDSVRLVTGRRTHVDATIDRIHKDGRLDITTTIGKETHTITACPCEEKGETPDTWHRAPDEPEEAKAQQA